jgi:glycosyltransferase involved in cell wall biosynthesis
MATVITHIYNEELLLPLWLEHHSRYFDEIIVVDFASTDNSRKIISKYKKAKIYDSTIDMWGVDDLDKMMANFERDVSGIRIVLNVTEFLLGNPKTAERDFFIPAVSLTNMSFDKDFNWSKQFWEQRSYGISYEDDFMHRRSRILAHQLPNYPLGRHFESIDSGGYLLVHVANCLVNEKMIDRKLQFQDKIPDIDKQRNLAFQHYRHGRRFTKQDVLEEQELFRSKSKDVSHLINAALTSRLP